MPRLRRIAPELPVANLPKALDYYRSKLGFQTVMTMPERDYPIVQSDDVAIHLFAAAPTDHPCSIHIFTDGLDELHAELANSGAQILQGIFQKPWGTRDFRVRDDSGNQIKFTE